MNKLKKRPKINVKKLLKNMPKEELLGLINDIINNVKSKEITNIKELVDSDIVTVIKKPQKSKIHNLNTLEDKITIYSGKEDIVEKEFNIKRAITKNYRQPAIKIKCSSPNCIGGPNKTVFEGVPNVFSEYGGQLVCTQCLRSKLGG